MAISKKTTKVSKNVPEEKSLAQLQKDLLAKQTDLVEAKRGHKLGELTNPRIITLTRKEIARLHTAIAQAERLDMTEVAL
jgi:ribosomal protein L29